MAIPYQPAHIEVHDFCWRNPQVGYVIVAWMVIPNWRSVEVFCPSPFVAFFRFSGGVVAEVPTYCQEPKHRKQRQGALVHHKNTVFGFEDSDFVSPKSVVKNIGTIFLLKPFVSFSRPVVF